MTHNTAHGQTGPKTEEGMMRSSLNALKHGLTARSPSSLHAIEAEAGVEHEDLLDRARSTYWPVDQIEDQLCKRIALCLRRLAQTETMERRLLERNPVRSAPGLSYEAVLRAERTVSLEMHRCIRTLTRKRWAENKKLRKTKCRPRSKGHLSERDFVFTKHEF